MSPIWLRSSARDETLLVLFEFLIGPQAGNRHAEQFEWTRILHGGFKDRSCLLAAARQCEALNQPERTHHERVVLAWQPIIPLIATHKPIRSRQPLHHRVNGSVDRLVQQCLAGGRVARLPIIVLEDELHRLVRGERQYRASFLTIGLECLK
jgi:hypothetical protein